MQPLIRKSRKSRFQEHLEQAIMRFPSLRRQTGDGDLAESPQARKQMAEQLGIRRQMRKKEQSEPTGGVLTGEPPASPTLRRRTKDDNLRDHATQHDEHITSQKIYETIIDTCLCGTANDDNPTFPPRPAFAAPSWMTSCLPIAKATITKENVRSKRKGSSQSNLLLAPGVTPMSEVPNGTSRPSLDYAGLRTLPSNDTDEAAQFGHNKRAHPFPRVASLARGRVMKTIPERSERSLSCTTTAKDQCHSGFRSNGSLSLRREAHSLRRRNTFSSPTASDRGLLPVLSNGSPLGLTRVDTTTYYPPSPSEEQKIALATRSMTFKTPPPPSPRASSQVIGADEWKTSNPSSPTAARSDSPIDRNTTASGLSMRTIDSAVRWYPDWEQRWEVVEQRMNHLEAWGFDPEDEFWVNEQGKLTYEGRRMGRVFSR